MRTYKEIRAGTITPRTLKMLFEYITDERTASLAMFYIAIHDAKDDEELEEIRKALKS